MQSLPSDSCGTLIAAVGLPGSGKSTVLAALAGLTGAKLYSEPEEASWGIAVHERDSCGHFTGLMWFRSERVPGYFRAARARSAGDLALLDSYYDKLCWYWLGRPGMDWLIAPTDPYFGLASAVARLDYQLLPLADKLVVFEVTPSAWREFVTRRGRLLDERAALLETYETQQYFVQAAECLAIDAGIEVVRFSQDRVDSPEAAAARLRSLLKL